MDLSREPEKIGFRLLLALVVGAMIISLFFDRNPAVRRKNILHSAQFAADERRSDEI